MTPPGNEENTGGPVGTWLPWVLADPSEARIGSAIAPPPMYGSDFFMDEVFEVIDGQANLTEEEQQIAQFWDDGPGTFTPPGHWVSIGTELIRDYGVANEDAVQILALLTATLNDAAIASFEAKYEWWSIRPITVIRRLCEDATRLCTKAELEADPSLATYPDWFSYLLTPPFPSYPGGHSTFSGARRAACSPCTSPTPPTSSTSRRIRPPCHVSTGASISSATTTPGLSSAGGSPTRQQPSPRRSPGPGAHKVRKRSKGMLDTLSWDSSIIIVRLRRSRHVRGRLAAR